MTANFNLEWEIVDGLRAVMQVANHNYYRIDNQRLAGNAISNQRRTYEKWGQTNRFSTQGYLNYRKTFAQDHTIEGTVGFDYMKNTVNGLSLTVTGADSDKVPTLAAGTDATGWADTNTNEALSSYFGRLNYDYKKKYLFMFTFRADGSSKFAEGNRWGYFPAASAGWVVSEEKFWNVRNFNSFKIRASYGLTGNNYIGLYDAYGGFGATSIYNGASAILPTALPNMRLKWETTHQLDIGVDMGFFNDRIRLIGRLLQQEDHRPALQRHAARYVGLRLGPAERRFSTLLRRRGGTLDGEHPEQELHLDDRLHLLVQHEQGVVAPRRVQVQGRRRQGCMAYRRVHDVGDGIPFRRHGRRRIAWGASTATRPTYIIETEAAGRRGASTTSMSHGHPPFATDRSDRRAARTSATTNGCNRAGSARDGGRQRAASTTRTCSMLGYVDAPLHRRYEQYLQVTGTSRCRSTSTMRWGTRSTTTCIRAACRTSIGQLQLGILIYDANDCWQKPGDNTKLARLSANDADGGNKNYSRISDINVQKGDYLCLRDVTLSYSFPKRWIGKLGLGNLTVSVSGNTLVYWTKVKGVSPESAVASSGSSTGMYSVVNTSSADYNIYPPTRKVMFSLKATF